MALAAYGGGALLLLLRPLWRGAALALAALGARLGPERLYHAGLATLNGISDRIHQIEVRDLRSRVATILAPAGVLVTAGFLATPTEGEFRAGTVGIDDIPLLLVLTVAATAAIAAAVPRQHLALALILSGLSYSLAVVYAILGAPNVALVAVLVETVTSLLIFGFLASMPRHVLRRAAEHPTVGSHRWRDPLVGVISGLIAFVVVWAVLSRPAARETVATEHIELTPVAHAGNVVSAILADFRGFDTLGEITVIGIALLGIATLLRGGRLR
jgi:multicomponent Na+:H+ antiporter subunit A